MKTDDFCFMIEPHGSVDAVLAFSSRFCKYYQEILRCMALYHLIFFINWF